MTLHFSQMGLTEGFTFMFRNLLTGDARLFRAPCDAAPRQIVGAHLECDSVSGQDANVVHPQLSGNVGQQDVAALTLSPGMSKRSICSLCLYCGENGACQNIPFDADSPGALTDNERMTEIVGIFIYAVQA